MKLIKDLIKEVLLIEYGISAGATDPVNAVGFYGYELDYPDQFSYWAGSPGEDLSSDPIFPSDALEYIGMTSPDIAPATDTNSDLDV